MKVLFFGAGEMGALAKRTIEGIEGVDLVDRGDYGAVFPAGVLDGIDLVFSASYPGRVTQDVCKLAALGAVNMHTGLLPRQRGWHPLNWALVWGDTSTGITIHKIVDSYDAGDVCVQQEVPIFESDTIVTLRARVEWMAPVLIEAFFEDAKFYLAKATKQNQAHVTYAPKRRPEDSELNLEATQTEQYNLWRSCHPQEYPCFVWRHGLKYLVINGRMDGGIFRYDMELCPTEN